MAGSGQEQARIGGKVEIGVMFVSHVTVSVGYTRGYLLNGHGSFRVCAYKHRLYLLHWYVAQYRTESIHGDKIGVQIQKTNLVHITQWKPAEETRRMT